MLSAFVAFVSMKMSTQEMTRSGEKKLKNFEIRAILKDVTGNKV